MIAGFVAGFILGAAAYGYYTTRWLRARKCAECLRQWTSGYLTPVPDREDA